MHKRFSIYLLLSLLICFLVPLDAVAKGKKKKKKKKRKAPKVSVTIDPFALAVPMVFKVGYLFDVNGEYKLKKKWGLSLGGSVGEIQIKSAKAQTKMLYTQGRWYPFGSFRKGMQLGGQILMASITGDYTAGINENNFFLFFDRLFRPFYYFSSALCVCTLCCQCQVYSTGRRG